MANRLKEMGETASWRLMVSAAIEGAKKAGYGQYILTLDDEVALYANAAASASQDELGQVRGGKAGLSDGQHTVVLMAAGGGPVDVDAFVFETAEGDGQQGCVDLSLLGDFRFSCQVGALRAHRRRLRRREPRQLAASLRLRA